MSSNVRTKNRQYHKIKKLVKEIDPDILLLIEVDQDWVDNISDLISNFSHSIIKPMSNTYGLILLSKFPLKDEQILFRVDDSVPSIKVKIVDEQWGDIRLHGLHPRPPRPSEAHSTERDAELMQIADEVFEEDIPTIVLGDLNDVAWSHSNRLFLRISGLLDPRRGRGFFNTFPSVFPWIGFPLDHIFISPNFNLVDLRVMPSIGSDHRPILIELEKTNYSISTKKRSSNADEMEKDLAIEKGRQWDGPFEEVEQNE